MYIFTILIVYLLLTVYTFIISERNQTMYQLIIYKHQHGASYHKTINHTITVSLEE